VNILQITPGAGSGFYCENCLRDGQVVRAWRRLGHEAAMVPLYLPPLAECPDDRPDAPIFYGGINVYLQQKWALFRKTPRWLDRLFDSPRLLGWVARAAGMTSARQLGEATLSTLRGPDGRQAKELRRLLNWLDQRDRPDVAILSNALLAGLARPIRERLGIPVVCTLQDEEGFLDGLGEPYAGRCWDLLASIAVGMDAWIAPSRYYAAQMTRRLGLPPDRVRAVHNGIDPTGYEPAPTPPDPPVIGFLSQMCRPKGLDTLVEAFIALKTGGRVPGLKLRAAGGKTQADAAFLAKIQRRIRSAGVAADVELLDAFDRSTKRAMLSTLSVLSVPTRKPEAFGLFVLEALASGVPVVLPRHGACPELIEATSGGLLCEPNDPDDLAAVLEKLLADPAAARAMGLRGREAVGRDFHADRTADQLVRIFRTLAIEEPR